MEREKKVTLRMRKIARKRVFGEITASKLQDGQSGRWMCCGKAFDDAKDIHRHVSYEHHEEIEKRTKMALHSESSQSGEQMCDKSVNGNFTSPCNCSASKSDEKSAAYPVGGDTPCRNELPDTCPYRRTSEHNKDALPWLPSLPSVGHSDKQISCNDGDQVTGEVLLFYKYVDLTDPEDICQWQKELCLRLRLRGKIRVAEEGLNGTVGGPLDATQLYISAVMAHPCFKDMVVTDFKRSKGGLKSFPDGLLVKVHREIVPMGIEPTEVSYKEAGHHLTPSEFHREILNYKEAQKDGHETETVLVDCRNFYESKIGQFEDALTPNIRKFSYWPEYVDKNEAVFADKRVLMYCTGGIRCERGSAYLKSKGICKEVLQLEGGIHRYIEQYPDGFYRGKLFVFDDRYSISTNDDVVAGCFYCSKPWDKYQPCTSEYCHQLVLSCQRCRNKGHTTCCVKCAELASTNGTENGKKRKEECSCTKNRQRVPVEGHANDLDNVSCAT